MGSWYSPKQNVETDEDNENEGRNKSENERDCHGNGNKVGQQSPTSIACVLKILVVNLNQILGVGKMYDIKI